ncbi:MAG TPA: biopolymer transporter ExbD [Capsulimonadaceae bacterium]|nr:biopolymer transporter ExbD [Capsulimonadaceae bacterium]
MARFRIPKSNIRRARIEIIPMIDTIFFLLVFFMFTSLSMVKMRGMGVSLPKDAANAAKPPPKAIVHVDKTGRYTLDTRQIPPAALEALLQRRVTSNPRTVIVVDVDKTQDVQTLITVMDAVNQVTTPAGDPAPVMIATSPVNTRGNTAARARGL